LKDQYAKQAEISNQTKPMESKGGTEDHKEQKLPNPKKETAQKQPYYEVLREEKKEVLKEEKKEVLKEEKKEQPRKNKFNLEAIMKEEK
jgi:hypothetical protein